MFNVCDAMNDQVRFNYEKVTTRHISDIPLSQYLSSPDGTIKKLIITIYYRVMY